MVAWRLGLSPAIAPYRRRRHSGCMEGQVGPLRAEITQGESERFTAPMLLVHGLWETAEVWRGVAGFLAHRGWHCVAVHLRGRAGSAAVAHLADHASDLVAAVAALDVPPVVLGHDLGGLLALGAAPQARAVVAMSPLVPRQLANGGAEALQHAGNLFSRWRGHPLSAPRGRWRKAFGATASNQREPWSLIRQLREEDLPVAASAEVPSLVVAGADDAVVALADARRMAERVGAEFLTVPGGHALPVEKGWQERAAAIHRWVVRRLGAPLLELYEEVDDDEQR